MQSLNPILRPDIMPFLIPIAAIMVAIVGIIVGGVVKVVKMVIVHRERMAKIAHGIDPDYAPTDDPIRR